MQEKGTEERDVIFRLGVETDKNNRKAFADLKRELTQAEKAVASSVTHAEKAMAASVTGNINALRKDLDAVSRNIQQMGTVPSRGRQSATTNPVVNPVPAPQRPAPMASPPPLQRPAPMARVPKTIGELAAQSPFNMGFSAAALLEEAQKADDIEREREYNLNEHARHRAKVAKDHEKIIQKSGEFEVEWIKRVRNADYAGLREGSQERKKFLEMDSREQDKVLRNRAKIQDRYYKDQRAKEKREFDHAARMQKQAEAERARLMAGISISNERFVINSQEAVESALRFATGIASLGIAGEENTEKMLRYVVAMRGFSDTVIGGSRALVRMRGALKSFGELVDKRNKLGQFRLSKRGIGETATDLLLDYGAPLALDAALSRPGSVHGHGRGPAGRPRTGAFSSTRRPPFHERLAVDNDFGWLGSPAAHSSSAALGATYGLSETVIGGALRKVAANVSKYVPWLSGRVPASMAGDAAMRGGAGSIAGYLGYNGAGAATAAGTKATGTAIGTAAGAIIAAKIAAAIAGVAFGASAAYSAGSRYKKNVDENRKSAFGSNPDDWSDWIARNFVNLPIMAARRLERGLGFATNNEPTLTDRTTGGFSGFDIAKHGDRLAKQEEIHKRAEKQSKVLEVRLQGSINANAMAIDEYNEQQEKLNKTLERELRLRAQFGDSDLELNNLQIRRAQEQQQSFDKLYRGLNRSNPGGDALLSDERRVSFEEYRLQGEERIHDLTIQRIQLFREERRERAAAAQEDVERTKEALDLQQQRVDLAKERYTSNAQRFGAATLEDQRDLIDLKKRLDKLGGNRGLDSISKADRELIQRTGIDPLVDALNQKFALDAKKSGFDKVFGGLGRDVARERDVLTKLKADLNTKTEVEVRLRPDSEYIASEIARQFRPLLTANNRKVVLEVLKHFGVILDENNQVIKDAASQRRLASRF